MEKEWSRRQLIKGLSVMPFAVSLGHLLTPQNVLAASEQEEGEEAKGTKGAETYALPPLPYPYDALEPHIDEQTLRVHHDKHHAGYVSNLNKAIQNLEEARKKDDFSLIKHWSRELAFNGSGHILHTLYWQNMTPKSEGTPKGALMEAIQRDFGGFDPFLKHFTEASEAVESNGWGVLAYEPMASRLVVLQAEKHQNMTIWGVVPLLICDVWEHAYYLKYQNQRGEYLRNFVKVINWEEVSRRYDAAIA